jgi:hypothetical protein
MQYRPLKNTKNPSTDNVITISVEYVVFSCQTDRTGLKHADKLSHSAKKNKLPQSENYGSSI